MLDRQRKDRPNCRTCAASGYLCRFLLLGVLAAGGSVRGWAEGQPLDRLPAADRERIGRALGAGVLGEPLEAVPLASPSTWFPSHPSSRRFVNIGGERAGEVDWYRLAPNGRDREGAMFQWDAADHETVLVRTRNDGSVEIAGVDDHHEHALTRYAPAEPLLPKGLTAGEEREAVMQVQVFESATARTPMHQGNLTVRCRYIGAYRLHLPAGSIEAVLIRSLFDGTIGPATIHDVQYRFFARGIGLVAVVEQRHVSAFYVYQADTRVARLLAEAPPSPQESRSSSTGSESNPP